MTDPVDQKLSDLPLVTPSGSDLLYAVHSAVSSKATVAAVAALLFTATGPTGVNGSSSITTGPTGTAGASSVATGPTGVNGAAVGPTGSNGSSMSFHQASPTPSLAVLDRGEITVTHPADGNAIPVAKIKIGSVYDPAVLGRATVVPIGSVNKADISGANRSCSDGPYSTSVKLPSGKVLLVGDKDYMGGHTSACTVYDPTTNSWTTTGSMTMIRQNFAVIRLNSGKILVCGGQAATGPTPTTSCELYDPDAGTWSAAGSLTLPHIPLNAVLLHDGRVLIIDGSSTGGGTCEIYNPVTNSWSATGSLNVARYIADNSSCIAAVMGDGRVLIVGCTGYTGTSKQCEIFDPAGNGGIGSWSVTASTNTTHAFSHQVLTLSDGRVLVCGGDYPTGRYISEIFNPITNSWTTCGQMTYSRIIFRAILLASGKVLAIGGMSTGYTESKTCELFDPDTGLWSAAIDMNYARMTAGAVLLGDSVLIVGGSINSSNAIAQVELYTHELSHTYNVGVDVGVEDPSDTETIFKNVTGSQNDFIFEVLSVP